MRPIFKWVIKSLVLGCKWRGQRHSREEMIWFRFFIASYILLRDLCRGFPITKVKRKIFQFQKWGLLCILRKTLKFSINNSAAFCRMFLQPLATMSTIWNSMKGRISAQLSNYSHKCRHLFNILIRFTTGDYWVSKKNWKNLLWSNLMGYC